MSCDKCTNCDCNTVHSILKLSDMSKFNDKIGLLSISELKELNAELKTKMNSALIENDDSSIMQSAMKLAAVYRTFNG
jgi:hypothetical protein